MPDTDKSYLLKRAFRSDANAVDVTKGMTFIRLVSHDFDTVLQYIKDTRGEKTSSLITAPGEVKDALLRYWEFQDDKKFTDRHAFLIHDLAEISHLYAEAQGATELLVTVQTKFEPLQPFLPHAGLRLIYDTLPEAEGWSIFPMNGLQAKLSDYAIVIDVAVHAHEGINHSSGSARDTEFMARLDDYNRDLSEREYPGASEISPQLFAKLMNIELVFLDQDSKALAELREIEGEEGGAEPVELPEPKEPEEKEELDEDGEEAEPEELKEKEAAEPAEPEENAEGAEEDAGEALEAAEVAEEVEPEKAEAEEPEEKQKAEEGDGADEAEEPEEKEAPESEEPEEKEEFEAAEGVESSEKSETEEPKEKEEAKGADEAAETEKPEEKDPLESEEPEEKEEIEGAEGAEEIEPKEEPEGTEASEEGETEETEEKEKPEESKEVEETGEKEESSEAKSEEKSESGEVSKAAESSDEIESEKLEAVEKSEEAETVESAEKEETGTNEGAEGESASEEQEPAGEPEEPNELKEKETAEASEGEEKASPEKQEVAEAPEAEAESEGPERVEPEETETSAEAEPEENQDKPEAQEIPEIADNAEVAEGKEIEPEPEAPEAAEPAEVEESKEQKVGEAETHGLSGKHPDAKYAAQHAHQSEKVEFEQAVATAEHSAKADETPLHEKTGHDYPVINETTPPHASLPMQHKVMPGQYHDLSQAPVQAHSISNIGYKVGVSQSGMASISDRVYSVMTVSMNTKHETGAAGYGKSGGHTAYSIHIDPAHTIATALNTRGALQGQAHVNKIIVRYPNTGHSFGNMFANVPPPGMKSGVG